MAVNPVPVNKVIYRSYTGVGLLLVIASLVAGVLALASFTGYMNGVNAHAMFVLSFLFFVLSTVI